MKKILTASKIIEYQTAKNNLKTIGDFKRLGIKLRDEFGLTDREAIDILNDQNVIEIMSKYELIDGDA